MKILKNILILLVLILGLSSCLNKTEDVKEKEYNLINTNWNQIKEKIKKLDKEWKILVIEYFSSDDEKKKMELEEKIKKHMIDIEWWIKDIKWETVEEKNREIQKITRKIKLYKSLGF